MDIVVKWTQKGKERVQEVSADKARVRIILLIYLVILGSSVASSAVFNFGVDPGASIEIPVTRDVRGLNIVPNKVSLIMFTKLLPCDMACEMEHAVASSWADRYPELQVVVVSLRNGEEELREFAVNREASYLLAADPDGVWEDVFKTNLKTTTFLVDQKGKVRGKLFGLVQGRLLAFDALISAAVRDNWDLVDSMAMRPLKLGERPYPLDAFEVVPGSPTVIYTHSATCGHCTNIVQQGIQEEINNLAARYPQAKIVLLEYIDDILWVEQYEKMDKEFIDVFGFSMWDLAKGMLDEEDIMKDPVVFPLPTDGWRQNVQIIRVYRGSRDDPGMMWGKTSTPNLIFFDSDGLFVGPTPFWISPVYDLEALVHAMDIFLQSHIT